MHWQRTVWKCGMDNIMILYSNNKIIYLKYKMYLGNKMHGSWGNYDKWNKKRNEGRLLDDNSFYMQCELPWQTNWLKKTTTTTKHNSIETMVVIGGEWVFKKREKWTFLDGAGFLVFGALSLTYKYKGIKQNIQIL